jgi:hypothetical protein
VVVGVVANVAVLMSRIVEEEEDLDGCVISRNLLCIYTLNCSSLIFHCAFRKLQNFQRYFVNCMPYRSNCRSLKPPAQNLQMNGSRESAVNFSYDTYNCSISENIHVVIVHSPALLFKVYVEHQTVNKHPRTNDQVSCPYKQPSNPPNQLLSPPMTLSQP